MAEKTQYSPSGSTFFMPPSRRRDKPQVSCANCRARKVKCDRSHPCQNCLKRGQAATCTYPNNNHPKKAGHSAPYSRAASMRQRVSQLETILQSLAPPGDGVIPVATTSKASPSAGYSIAVDSKPMALNMNIGATSNGHVNIDEVPDNGGASIGRLRLDNEETSYVSSTHWAAALDEVRELKDILESGESPNSSSGSGYGRTEDIDLLFSAAGCITQAEILASIPPKTVTDRLISRYFSEMDMAPVIHHVPTFQREYETFWENQWGTPIMWVGALFGMMCLAEHFNLIIGDGPSGLSRTPEKTILKYREKAAQCLILGNYSKAGNYVLEALVIYLATEQLRTNDVQFGLGILSGIVVRTAMRMGYQRDPSHYPNISVLQAEMRRRLWSTVVISDILISYQVGLPKLINESQSDTNLPRNLLEEDLDESTTESPLSRPDSECTLMAYAIAKHKLTSVFGMIAELASSPRAVSYTDDILRLDKLLYDIHDSFPPGLSMRPIANSITDSTALISRRFALETLFQKSRCVLHRRYLAPARSENQYLYSRQSCVAAAIQLLHHQFVLHNECQPGGFLYRDSWKVAPLMNQGFLLAAMIICLEIDHLKNGIQNVPPPYEQVHVDDMLRALQKSFIIWNEKAESSEEAQRASSVLKIILDKVSTTSNAKGVAETEHPSPAPGSSKYSGSHLDNSSPARSIGSSSSPFNPSARSYHDNGDFWALPQYGQLDANDMELDDTFALENMDLIASMIKSPSNLDWDVWDHCV